MYSIKLSHFAAFVFKTKEIRKVMLDFDEILE